MELKLLSKEDFRKGGDVMGTGFKCGVCGGFHADSVCVGRLGESIRRVGMAS